MEKMNFESKDIKVENIKKIEEIFPSCITEIKDKDGNFSKAIDFEALKQILSGNLAEGIERYEFTWPGKNESILEANRPIKKTLRPCKEESKNWDITENLYIEGDNLDALKLLQESYLGKVKMIYIDPPYNTGSDFIYDDDFKEDMDDYVENTDQVDEEGNRFFQNTETNGRFHSDWCSMIYPRLILARNLLSEDGVIFISIDDNEHANLKKICDEIFGETNFITILTRKTKTMTGDDGNGMNIQHDYVLIYSKTKNILKLNGDKKSFKDYSNPDNDPNGIWTSGDPSAKSGGPSTYFPIENPFTKQIDYPPKGRYWAFSKDTLNTYINNGRVKFKKTKKANQRGFIFKRYAKYIEDNRMPVNTLEFSDNIYINSEGTDEIKDIFNNNYFSYPKPTSLIKELVKISTVNKETILDFFSGSGTTAHAVMQLNAEDGGNRKFIMVQLPEETNEKSAAYKAVYKNICEIGKERIRRAGDKVLEDNKDKDGIQNLDIGFRVLKVDSTNMKDVYYKPDEYNQGFLDEMVSNIKADRTDLDLLFACLLEWGLPLTKNYVLEEIQGKKIHNYDRGALVACFEENIDEEIVKEMANKEAEIVVFRDSSFKTSADKINVEEIFKELSPDTSIKIM